MLPTSRIYSHVLLHVVYIYIYLSHPINVRFYGDTNANIPLLCMLAHICHIAA